MNLVLVTGMSGAGKSTVLNILEDRQYFRVDNLPPSLLQVFCDLLESQQEVSKAAVGIDIRSGNLGKLPELIKSLKDANHKIEIIYLEADQKTLIKRYQETRRIHPLTEAGQIEESIRKEREKVEFLKSLADYVIDTSGLLTRQLKHQMNLILVEDEGPQSFVIDLRSFGFKHGILEDGDMIFDVRFLKNPFYDENLRRLTGNDEVVYQYVMESKEAEIFVDKLVDLINFLIPQYQSDGRNQIVVGIGCTGGHHRSVSIVRALEKKLQEMDHCLVRTYHRDIVI